MSGLFEADGEQFRPGELARGPWDPGALHGGPTAALLARAVEGELAGAGTVQVSRMTVELLRPVPVAPLVVEARTTRPGRKVQLVEASVRAAASGTEVAWARALAVRTATVALPEGAGTADPAPPGPDDLAPGPVDVGGYAAFHNAGAELRFAIGTFAAPGPVLVWVRLQVPVVAGEEPSPLQRVMAAADFGNGVSHVLSFDDYVFINPDLTVHLARDAVGEWIALDARTILGLQGAGMAESTLYDAEGRFGRAAQSLLVDRR